MKNTRQAGRAFVKRIIEKLKDIDPATYEIVGSGAGKEKGDLRIPRFDLVGEAKDHTKAQVAAWVEQSEKEGLNVNNTALFWRHPKSPKGNPDIRVDISIDFFKELLSRYGEPKIKSEDRTFLYKLSRLKEAIREVEKEID
jgi:hypothetical protein